MEPVSYTHLDVYKRQAFNWPMPLPEIARVWREGCIIRSSMLNDMATALAEDPNRNLMLAPFFADHLKSTHLALRQTCLLYTSRCV